jgi:hypothetical protein
MATVQEYAVKLTADSAEFESAFDRMMKKPAQLTKSITDAFKGIDTQIKSLTQNVDKGLEEIAQAEIESGKQQIKAIEATTREKIKLEGSSLKERTKLVGDAGKEIEAVVKSTGEKVKAVTKQASAGFTFKFPIDGVRKDLDDLSSLIRDFRTNDQSFNRKFQDANRKIREAGARGELGAVRAGFDQIAADINKAHQRQLAELKQAQNAELVSVADANARRLQLEQQLSQQLQRVRQTRNAELARVEERGPQQRVGQIQGGQIFANIGAEAARAQLGGMLGPLGNITGMLGKIHPAALAATAGIGLLATGFSKASAAGAELEQGTAKIQSVLSGTQAAALPKEIGNLRKEAVATGIPIKDLQDGLYNVIGAVPALANNLSAATSITEKAAKTALGMGASTDSVAMAMTGLGNAAGLSLESVKNQDLIMNVLAKTMKDGVIPNGEALAGAIGKAAPTVAALAANGQLAVKSIGAMTAVLTGAGVSVDEAQTKIKALSSELLEGEKRSKLLAAGVQGIDAATGKVTDFGALFSSMAEGGADLVNVFTSKESQDAVRIFTQNGGKSLAEMTAGFENASGTAKTMFDAMANTAEQTGKRMDASINEFWLTVNDSIGASGITGSLQSFAADAIGSLTEFLKPASQLFDETITKANELNQLQSTSADIASQIGEALASTEGISAGGADVIFSQISSQMEAIAEQSPIAAQEIQKMMDGMKAGSIDTATAMGTIKKEMETISLMAEGNKMTTAFEASQHSIEAVNEVLDEATGWWDDIAEGIETALNILLPFTNLISGMASLFGFDIGESMQADTFKDMGKDLETAKGELAALKAEAEGLRSDPQAFAEKMKEVIEAQKEVNKLQGDSDKIQKGLNDAVKQQLDIQLQLLGGNAEQIDKLGLAAQIASQFPDALAESAGFQEQINKLVDEELAGAAERAKEKQKELDLNNNIAQVQAGLASEDAEILRGAQEQLVAMNAQAEAGDKLVATRLQESGLQAEVAKVQKELLIAQIAELKNAEDKNGFLSEENKLRLASLQTQLQKIEKLEFENQLLEIQNSKLVEQADLEENINQRLDSLKDALGVEQLTNAERISGLKTILAQNDAKIKQLEIEKQQAGLSKERQIQLEKELNVMRSRGEETKGQLGKAQATETTRGLLGTKDPVIIQREKKAADERIKAQEDANKEAIAAKKKMDDELEKARKQSEQEAQKQRERALAVENIIRNKELEEEKRIFNERIDAENHRVEQEKLIAKQLNDIQKQFGEKTLKIIDDAASHIESIRQSVAPAFALGSIDKLLSAANDQITEVEKQSLKALEQGRASERDKSTAAQKLQDQITAAQNKQANALASNTKTIMQLIEKVRKEGSQVFKDELVAAVDPKVFDPKNAKKNIELMRLLLEEQNKLPKVWDTLFNNLRQPLADLTTWQDEILKADAALKQTNDDLALLRSGNDKLAKEAPKQTGAVSGIKILEGQVALMETLIAKSKETEEGMRSAFDADIFGEFQTEMEQAQKDLLGIVQNLGGGQLDLSDFDTQILKNIKDQIDDAKQASKDASADGKTLTEVEARALDNALAVLDVLSKQFATIEKIAAIDTSEVIAPAFESKEVLDTMEGLIGQIRGELDETTESAKNFSAEMVKNELALRKERERLQGLINSSPDPKALVEYRKELERINKAYSALNIVEAFQTAEQEISNANVELANGLKAAETGFKDTEESAEKAAITKAKAEKQAFDDLVTRLEKEKGIQDQLLALRTKAQTDANRFGAEAGRAAEGSDERKAAEQGLAQALETEKAASNELLKINDAIVDAKAESKKRSDEIAQAEKDAGKKAEDDLKAAIEGSKFEKFATDDLEPFVENFKKGIEDIKTAAKEGGKEGKAAATAAVLGMVQGFANVTEGLVVQGKAIADMFQAGDAGGATQAIGGLTTQIGKALLGAKNPNIQIAGAVILGIGLLTTAVGRIVQAIKGREQTSLELAEARAKVEERSQQAMERQLDAMERMVALGDRSLDQAEEQNRARQRAHDLLVAESELAAEMAERSDKGLSNEIDKQRAKEAAVQAEIEALEASKELGREERKQALEALGLDSSGNTADKVDEAIARRQAQLVDIQTKLGAAEVELAFREGNVESLKAQLDEALGQLDFLIQVAIDDQQFGTALALQQKAIDQLVEGAEGALASIGQVVDFTGLSFDEMQKAILALDMSQVSPAIQEMLSGILEGASKLEDIRRQEMDHTQEIIGLRESVNLITGTQAHEDMIVSLEAELAFLRSIHAEEADILGLVKELQDLRRSAFNEERELIDLRKQLGRITDEDAKEKTLDSLEAELLYLMEIGASEKERLKIELEILNLKKEQNAEDETALKNLSKLVRDYQEMLKSQRAISQGGTITPGQQAQLDTQKQAIASQLRQNGASEDEISAFLADLPAFAKGGMVQQTGLGLVTEGELVLTRDQQRQMEEQITAIASMFKNPIAEGTDNLSRTIAQTILQREVNSYVTNQAIDLSGLSINLNLSGGSPQAVAKEVQKVIPSVIHDIVNRGLQQNKIDVRQGNSV